MPVNRIADFVILFVIVATQVLIARRWMPQWRSQLSPSKSRAMLTAFWFFQGIVACNVVFALFLNERRTFLWLPSAVRSMTVALGMLGGIGMAASLSLWTLVSALGKRIAPEHSPARRQLLRTAGKVGVAAPFAVAGWGGIVGRTNFQVKEVTLPVPGLHPDLEGLRVGQLSDLHVSPFLSARELGRAVDMLNELRPHLIAVTGDLITRRGDPLDDAIRELARLRADAGVFGCMGNHEEYAGAQGYITQEAARYGMDFLTFQARQLRFGQGILNVGGIDYQNFVDHRRYLRGAERLIVPGAANLLLSHNPEVFPAAAKQGWGATLAGHTHGGQITVERVNQTLNFARLVTPYVAGLYRHEGASCYVNSGIGTITVPVRFGAPPEITLLKLTRASGVVPDGSVKGNANGDVKGAVKTESALPSGLVFPHGA